MILPSVCRRTSLVELGRLLNWVVTMPFVPKVESSVPDAASALVAVSSIVMTMAVSNIRVFLLKDKLAFMVFCLMKYDNISYIL